MNEIGVKEFSLRRKAVVKALRWLNKYNAMLYCTRKLRSSKRISTGLNRRQLPPMVII
jgi:hypothetical protein